MRRKLIITTMISIILALGFTIDFACADVNDGLVGYYPFDGNSNDDSGHVYHGLIHGNPDFVLQYAPDNNPDQSPRNFCLFALVSVLHSY